MKKTAAGRYEGTIVGRPARVYRTTVGENRYGKRSNTIEWKVRVDGVVYDGHGTMRGAIEAAKRGIAMRQEVAS